MSNLIEYWYLWLIFAVLLIVTVFVGKKAAAAAAIISSAVRNLIPTASSPWISSISVSSPSSLISCASFFSGSFSFMKLKSHAIPLISWMNR